MQKEYLGEFEELVLTMVGILQEDAYGNAIVNEIKDRVGRAVNLSAGRRKRIFTITNAGLAILRAKKEQQVELWKLVPQLKISGI